MKKSIGLYNQKRQQLILRFNGAEDAIKSLENAIEQQPTTSRAVRKINGYKNYIKSTHVKIYDTLMYRKEGITIHYVVHNDDVIFLDIF